MTNWETWRKLNLFLFSPNPLWKFMILVCSPNSEPKKRRKIENFYNFCFDFSFFCCWSELKWKVSFIVELIFQIGYLDVVIPPDFIPEETSSDVIVPEGSSVKLTCRFVTVMFDETHKNFKEENVEILITLIFLYNFPLVTAHIHESNIC